MTKHCHALSTITYTTWPLPPGLWRWHRRHEELRTAGTKVCPWFISCSFFCWQPPQSTPVPPPTPPPPPPLPPVPPPPPPSLNTSMYARFQEWLLFATGTTTITTGTTTLKHECVRSFSRVLNYFNIYFYLLKTGCNQLETGSNINRS